MSFYGDFAPHYEAIFPWRPAVHDFLAAHLPPPPARLLDLGCGPGHHCGRMAAAGHAVLGLDSDPKMIAAAEGRYPEARFRCLDVARTGDLAGEGPFDAAWCLGNVLPHVPAGELPGMLAGLAGLLRPGAAFIVQTVNWDALLDDGAATRDFPDRELPDGHVFSRRYEGIAGEGRALRFLTRLSRGGRTLFAGEARLHPLRAAGLQARAAEAGLDLEAVLGDFDGRPFDPGSSPAAIHVFRRDPTGHRPR